ncbi:nucleotidyltransferase domain-containing protein [bacterium]|nr:nucleotidyltransferase domain-containing protein [bacterium]MBU1600085.1 nucleotidyltransferase domain-containing protein [bacterium]
MATVSDEVIKKIQKFLDMITSGGIQLERVILFGSYARGNANRWSDIDIALVSKDFQGIGFYDRQKINPYILRIDTRIEPHPYRIEDFIEDDPFIKEILNEGIEIAVKKCTTLAI